MLTDEMRANGWIEHDGGPCPVDADACVRVRLRGNPIPDDPDYADTWDWRWWELHPDGDIIAYKPENSRADR